MQQVQLTFYGHAGVATEVAAACKVEGGPVYQLRLSGEASEVQYKFNKRKIDLGRVVSMATEMMMCSVDGLSLCWDTHTKLS